MPKVPETDAPPLPADTCNDGRRAVWQLTHPDLALHFMRLVDAG
jgi:hypothetical protein